MNDNTAYGWVHGRMYPGNTNILIGGHPEPEPKPIPKLTPDNRPTVFEAYEPKQLGQRR